VDAPFLRLPCLRCCCEAARSGRRAEFSKDVELVLLRRQLSVLARQQQRPKLRPADRACIAALVRLPYRRRHGLVVTQMAERPAPAARNDCFATTLPTTHLSRFGGVCP